MIQSPFKFLDAYEKEDGDRFFGRERETAQLYNAVHASNLVLLYGASGTGKTSLVRCGLGNQFIESDWLPLSVRRGTDMMRSLHFELDRALAAENSPPDLTVSAKVRELYLEHYRPVYLILDQFEELYVLGSPQEQRRFHQTAHELLSAGLQCKVILVIREEYLAYLSEFEKVVPSLFDNRLRIEKMNDANLGRVVVGTAERAGIDLIEPLETVGRIIGNVRNKREGVDLTNLQVYLDRLWREDRARRSSWEGEDKQAPRFDPELVDRVGRIGNVLSDFLDHELDQIERKLGERGMPHPDGVPLEVLFTLVTDDGTKRPLAVNQIIESLPMDRDIDEDDVLFCLKEFARIKVLRQLAEH